jgi:hypothetical protein
LNKIVAFVGACWLFGAASSPAAALTITAAPGALTGSVPGGVVDFSGPTNGITFSGTGIVVSGTVPGSYANPMGYTGNYMALEAGTSETLTFGGATKDIFGLYWGSIDNYNSVEFLLNGVQVGSTITGSDLIAPIVASGNQTASTSNAYITFSGLSFDEVVLSSSGNSFEFTNVAAAAPELSTWAMMTLGFLAVGFLAYRKKDGPAFRLNS